VARREISPAEAPSIASRELTPDQVLGDWFPDRTLASADTPP
jgi:hypothetical protein